ncbi:hypothetical protein COOONC_06224, partial [Cooperia oncophora]
MTAGNVFFAKLRRLERLGIFVELRSAENVVDGSLASCHRQTLQFLKSGYASAFLRRQGLRGSRRRTRFSIIGPEVIVDGPGSSTEALPASSREASYRSMGSLPRVDLDASEDDPACDIKPVTFRRRYFRDGHKSVSGRDVHLSCVYDSENSDIALTSPFK